MVFDYRQTDPSDLETVAQILRDGRDFQRQQGFIQWTDAFPDMQELEAQIQDGQMYLFLVNGEAAGCFLVADAEPAYGKLPEHSKVIHRTSLAKAWQGKHLSHAYFEQIKKAADGTQLWIDTMPENHRMIHVLEREGFCRVMDVMYPFGLRTVYRL